MGHKGRPRTRTTWRAKTEADLDPPTRVLLAECKAAYEAAQEKRQEADAAQRNVVRLVYALRASGASVPIIARALGRSRKTIFAWTHDLSTENEYLMD